LPVVVQKGTSLDVCVEAVGPTGGAATVTIEATEGTGTCTLIRDFAADVDEASAVVAGLAPNPAYESVTITMPPGTTHMRIVDIHGSMVFSSKVDAPTLSWNGVMHQGAMVPPGVYTVVLEGTKHTVSLPLVMLR
jgi:hypothetical protein